MRPYWLTQDCHEVLCFLRDLSPGNGVTAEGLELALGLSKDRVALALLDLRRTGQATPHRQGPEKRGGIVRWMLQTLWTATRLTDAP